MWSLYLGNHSSITAVLRLDDFGGFGAAFSLCQASNTRLYKHDGGNSKQAALDERRGMAEMLTSGTGAGLQRLP